MTKTKQKHAAFSAPGLEPIRTACGKDLNKGMHFALDLDLDRRRQVTCKLCIRVLMAYPEPGGWAQSSYHTKAKTDG